MSEHLETFIREEIKSFNKDITPLQDIFTDVMCTRELRSTYVSTKRMCGKTTLINKLMCEFGSSIVFVLNNSLSYTYHPFLKNRVFNINSNFEDRLRGIGKEPFFPLQYVFTDECKLSNEQISSLYQLGVVDRKTIFIGLGTDFK